jgi:PBP1b-binding outer membrane lipoprotein LpoB
MNHTFLILLIVALAGCANNKAVVPSLEGKPRVKINQQVPASTAQAPVNTNTQVEK